MAATGISRGEIVIRVLLILVGLVVAGGIMFGGYKLVQYAQNREYSDDNTDPVFVDLSPIVVSIAKDGEIVDSRSYQISLETREGGPHREVLREKIRLQDLMIRYLNAFAQRRPPDNIDNPEYMKHELLLACADLLGKDTVVRGVYFTSILTRPPR